MTVKAKVVLASISGESDEFRMLSFVADYSDEGNKEWSYYTPSLSLNMTVRKAVADNFTANTGYMLSFDKLPAVPVEEG